MKITADTNVLLRDALRDDPKQWLEASRTLQQADSVAVSISALCEFVWVLRQGYGYSTGEIAGSMRLLLASDKVVTNRLAAEAGLRVLDGGGDFADGAIAYEGEWLGAEEFVSFDKQAVRLLKTQGRRARLLG